MDKFRIDGHKLGWHVDRVASWQKGDRIYPIYMEISPSGGCNHRCSFCGVDYLGYKSRFLDAAIIKYRLTELGGLGLKSVMYCGEGEPLLHKEIGSIINHTKKSGIDVAVTTNGVFLTEKLAEESLGSIEWIKVSFNAGTPATYMKVNGAKEKDFQTVLANLTVARKIKEREGYKTVLGMQMILLPENRKESAILAGIAKDIGLDYLVIKPYSQHPQSRVSLYKDIRDEDLAELEAEVSKFNGDGFSVIFRSLSIRKREAEEKPYSKCAALPFWSYIDSGGGVWGCLDYVGDDRFYYGDIYSSSFQEVWESERRLKSLKWVENEMDCNVCRSNCRMDEVNKYLWSLKNPPQHVNFI
jgi:MoaA/NifB/PqqE/SkfB family radical SAM enzyme